MVRSLASGARDRGWEPELGFSELAVGRDWYERLGSEFSGSVFTVPDGSRREDGRWLLDRLAQPGPVLLHTHFTRFDVAAAWLGRRRPGTAVVWHLHTPHPPTLRSRLRDTIKFRLLGRGVNAILASGADPAMVAIRAGARADRVEVVGGGIETARFTPPTGEGRFRARNALSIPETGPVLLHFAWDWELKGGELFLEAVRALVDSDQLESPLAITVGGGEAARRGVERLGLDDDFRLIEPTDDVQSLYRAADLFVSTSRMEGQPFAVIESILSGLPVVAVDLPGHRDICEQLDSCRVVEPAAEPIADAAVELLGRPADESERQAAEARRGLESRFDLTPWTERMLDRYRAALEEVDPSGASALKPRAH